MPHYLLGKDRLKGFRKAENQSYREIIANGKQSEKGKRTKVLKTNESIVRDTAEEKRM